MNTAAEQCSTVWDHALDSHDTGSVDNDTWKVSITTLERRLARAQRRARDAGSAWIISFMAGDLDAMDVEAEDAEHWRGEAATLSAEIRARRSQ